MVNRLGVIEMAKQTAGNNLVLANIKRQMNHKIYARALEIMNTSGEDELRRYMGQFFNDEYREESLRELFGKSLPSSESRVKSLRRRYGKGLREVGEAVARDSEFSTFLEKVVLVLERCGDPYDRNELTEFLSKFKGKNPRIAAEAYANR